MTTVKQLIEKLKQFDPELKVMLNGYEGGLYSPTIDNINEFTVALDVNSEWYYGPHEVVNHTIATRLPEYKTTKAVIL